MTKRTFIFIASVLSLLIGAFLIPPVVAQNSNLSPRTTTWSRTFLTNTTALGALATIGANPGYREIAVTPAATINFYMSNRVEQIGAYWTMGQDEYFTITGTHAAGTELFIVAICDGTSRQITLSNTNFYHPEGSGGMVFKVKAGKRAILRFISDGTYFNEVDGREPRGMIKPWGSTIASIPDGYVLCDGNNGSPDLRNSFVVGANADDSGVAKTTILGAAAQTGGGTHVDLGVYSTTGTFTPVALATTAITGYTEDVPIVPPFYALAYIYKL